MDRFTHLDAHGEARMVDITSKDITTRTAEASGNVVVNRNTLDKIRNDSMAKGDVLGVARIAGILAAKRTSDLIPLCHGLSLTSVDIRFELLEDQDKCFVHVLSQARTEAKTGVEMEALVAVSVAALTIYDMCKSVDRGMTISNIQVTHKSGGRSGTYGIESTMPDRTL